MKKDVELYKWMGGAVMLFFFFIGLLQLKMKAKENKAIASAENAFGPMNEIQKDSIRQIVRAFEKYGDKDPNKFAYIMATTRHESGFKPIKEYRATPSQTRVYELQNRYWPSGYYGRGFVQLTWENNYRKMSDFLGVDLVKNPDLALNPKYAAQILVYGMMKGSFTGKKLSDYINSSKQDFYNARKIVNGLDKTSLFETSARQFLNVQSIA